MTTGDYNDGNPVPVTLSPEHRKMLTEESGINDDVIKAAGLFTVRTVIELKALGFTAYAAKQIPLPALAFPVMGVAGDTGNYRLRPDTPRTVNGQARKYEQKAGVGVALYVPPTVRESLRRPDIPIIVTEGERKALCGASHGLCTIGLMGVDCFRGKNEFGGTSILPDWQEVDLKGRLIYICFDSDWKYKNSVAHALKRLYEWLKMRGADPMVVYLEDKPNGSKMGLDDFLASGKTTAELFALADKLVDVRALGQLKADVKKITEDTNALPVIETNDRELRDMSADTLAALIAANNPPNVFVSGGALVRIKTDEHCRPVTQALDVDSLRWHVARSANFISTSEKRGAVTVFPPVPVVTDVLNAPNFPEIPILAGVVTAPIFAPDGTLCATPGYHSSSRFYYYQYGNLDLPDTTPTGENVKNALALLMEDVFADFPFDTLASKANALALMLLPFVRPMIEGATPIHIISAPQKGTGKGLLADACALPFIPQGLEIVTPPVTKEEWQKTLMANLSESPSHFLLDNARTLDSVELDAALTTPNTYKGRVLGTSQNRSVPVKCVWICTANNLEAKGDLSRRAVWIRLDAGTEKPYELADFKHPDLRKWIRQNRAKIVGACLTLIRVWVDAGCPAYAGKANKGSYESWLSVMGGILEILGFKEFSGNSDDAEDALDSDLDAWRGFLKSWWHEYKSVRNEASAADLVPCAAVFFPDDEKLNDERHGNQRMGYMLKKNIDRTAGNYKLVRCKPTDTTKHKMSKRYAVVQIKPSPEEAASATLAQDTHGTAQPTASVATQQEDSAFDEIPVFLKELLRKARAGEAYKHKDEQELILQVNPRIATHDINMRIQKHAGEYAHAHKLKDTDAAQEALRLLELCQKAIVENSNSIPGE